MPGKGRGPVRSGAAPPGLGDRSRGHERTRASCDAHSLGAAG